MKQSSLLIEYIGAGLVLLIFVIWFIKKRDFEPLAGFVSASVVFVVLFKVDTALDLGLTIALLILSMIGLIFILHGEDNNSSIRMRFDQLYTLHKTTLLNTIILTIVFIVFAWFLRSPNLERFALLAVFGIVYLVFLYISRSQSFWLFIAFAGIITVTGFIRLSTLWDAAAIIPQALASPTSSAAPTKVGTSIPSAGATSISPNPASETTTTLSGNPIPSSTPSSISFTLVTQDGEDVPLTLIELGEYGSRTYGAVFYGYKGIPTNHGEFISFDYISRVDIFNEDEEYSTINITLTNKRVLITRLKTFGFTKIITGKTEFGDFHKDIREIKTIIVQRQSSVSIPETLPIGISATVVYTDRSTIDISNPRLTSKTRHSMNIYGFCDISQYSYIPTSAGVNIDFSKIKGAVFVHEEESQKVSIIVTTLTDKQIEYELGERDADIDYCWLDRWRLQGDTRLGIIESPIGSIREIIVKPTSAVSLDNPTPSETDAIPTQSTPFAASTPLGTLLVKTPEGCDGTFQLATNDRIIGDIPSGRETFVPVGTYTLTAINTVGRPRNVIRTVTRNEVIISEGQKNVVDFTENMGVFLLESYPKAKYALAFHLFQDGEDVSNLYYAGEQFCAFSGKYTIEIYPYIPFQLNSPWQLRDKVAIDIEIKAKEKLIIKPNEWSKQLGLVSFMFEGNEINVQIINLQTGDLIGGVEGVNVWPRSGYWMFTGKYKFVFNILYAGGTFQKTYDNIELKAGEELVLQLPKGPSP